MPPVDRSQAIAAAEQCVRDAAVGKSQLLAARHRSSRDLVASQVERLRSLGATDEQITKMSEFLARKPARSEWHIQFLLHDSRYVDGITAATVIIDDATGAAELSIFRR